MDLKNDNKIVTVSEVAEVVLGGTPKTSIPEYWNGDIKWASAKDVSNCNSRYILDTEKTVTQEGINDSAAKILPKDTIVITARGTVGKIVLLSEPMSFNQTCYGLVSKDDVLPLYLYYKLITLLSHIGSLSYGTVFDTITMKTFNEITFELPSIPEQKKIVNILSSLDKKIELNQQMNKTLEAIGQVLFKQWFIDFEFPNEEGKPYKSNGEMVYSEEFEKEVPKGWEVKPIDKIAIYLNGLAMQKYPPKGEEYFPVIKIREMKQGITENTDKASKNIPKDYIIDDGDIIFSWSGSLDICIWGHGKGALNQHLFKVTSEEYPKWFYYYWIKYYMPHFRHIASDKVTTMGHIKRNHLTDTYVVIPPKELCDKLDKILSPTVNKYVETCIESRNLEKIRDTLLPKLMSGQIRAPVEVD